MIFSTILSKPTTKRVFTQCNSSLLKSSSLLNGKPLGRYGLNILMMVFVFILIKCIVVVNAQTCRNLDATDPHVCSGHGRCVSNDNCECNQHYRGNLCQYTTCFGEGDSPYDANWGPFVCSGHGACLSYNNCSCEIGWYGDKCENYKHVYNPFQGYSLITYETSGTSNIILPGYYATTYSNNPKPALITSLKQSFDSYSSQSSVMYLTYINAYNNFDGTPPFFKPFICGQDFFFQGGEKYLSYDASCSYDSVTLTFNGTEPIYVEISSMIAKNITFKFLNCASYNTIYWRIDRLELNGDFHGIVATSSLSGQNAIIHGTMIIRDQFLNFDSVTFSNFSIWDPYQSYLSPSCAKPSINICFGKLATSKKVCGGHGKCVGQDQCQCNYGISGVDCTIINFTCNGLAPDKPEICGDGYCISQDTCQCNHGVQGSSCHITCYGYRDQDNQVCSGHGACLSYNNCTCEIGWYGDQCENYKHVYNPFQGHNLVSYDSTLAVYTPISFPSYFYYYPDVFTVYEIPSLNSISLSKEKSKQMAITADRFYNQFLLTDKIDFDCGQDLVFKGGLNYQTQTSGCTFDSTTLTFDGADIISILTADITFNNVNFVFKNCASYNNIYWQTAQTRISGDFYGTLYISSSSLDFSDAQIYGTIIVKGILTGFSNTVFHNFSMFDPYQPYLSKSCNSTLISCYGYVNTSAGVCSGNGVCVKEDQCQCKSGYKGKTCEIIPPTCFGMVEGTDVICSNHGSCVSQDKCLCDEGYYEATCNSIVPPTCNGIPANHPSVCYGHGRCLSWENCDCNPPYQNSVYCKYSADYNCFTLDRLDPTVCSGHGQCVGSDHCVCNSNYDGTSCQRNVSSNLPSVIANSTILVNQTQNNSNSSLFQNSTSVNNGTILNNATINNSSMVNTTQGYNISLGNSTISNNSSIVNNTQVYNNMSLINSTLNNLTNNTTNVSNKSVVNSTYTGNNSLMNNTINSSNSSHYLNSTNNSSISVVANETIVVTRNETHISNNSIVNNNQSLNYSQVANETASNNNTLQINTSLVSNTSIVNETTNTTELCSNTSTGDSNNTFINQSIVNNIAQSNSSMNETTVGNQTVFENNSIIDIPNQANNETSNITEITNSTLLINSTIIFNNTISNNTSSVLPSNVTNNSTFIPINNTGINNQSITNSTILYTQNETMDNSNSTINCNRIVNCSNHGDCNSKGQCICSSNYEEGYWSGNNCQACEINYYGKLCNTKIVGPALISPDFMGVTFILHSPDMVNDSIPCEKIINPLDLAIFGSKQSNVKCQYSDRSNDVFMISFGSLDFNFTPGTTTIQINTQAFENILVRSTPKYISLVITVPEKTVGFSKPVLLMPNVNQYSSCDTISADGSSSYSFDGRSLTFYWFLLDSNMNILSESFPNQPKLTLDSSVPPNSYRIGLIVKSNFLNTNSSLIVSSIFSKATAPLPMLTMYKGETVIEKYTNEFPITLKKIVMDSSCKSSTDTIQIEWSQVSGPVVNHTVDSFNNLIIPKLTVFGNYTYVFRVFVFYNSNQKVSIDVTLRTKSPELMLNILQVAAISDATSLQIDYLDPEAIFNEESTEVWNWTSDNQSPSLLTHLQTLSSSKSVQFSILSELLESKMDSIFLTLEITKSDGRSIQKSTTIYFNNIPPLVNIVSIEPISPVIVPGQLITIQTLTVSNSSNTTWVLNNKIIGISSIVSQPSLGSETNTISIDSSILEQGSVNSLTIFTYDTKTGLSTQTNYTFQVASVPRACSCDVTPKEGEALATDFVFYCENCKTTDNNIDYRYGFIDDRSQSKIVMYNLGEVYSTKIPAPFTGTSVTCFIDIVDKTTGAFSTTLTNVTIYKPLVNNIAEIQNIVQQWESQSMQYTIDGDFSKSIYQSASTSRTDSVFLKEAFSSYSSTRRDSIVCQNGVDISGECKCRDGWIGKQCELSISDFSNIQGTKLSILKDMIFVVNNTAGMSDEYVSLLSFAIDSLLVNYPYLDTNTISEALSTLNTFLNYAISDQSVRVSEGVDVLIYNCLEFAFKYITNRQYVIDQTSNSDNLHTALKKSFSLQARSYSIGSAGKSKKGPYFSAVLNRNTLYDFPRSMFDPISRTKVVFESKLLATSNSASIVKKPFISILTVSHDIFSLNSRLQNAKKIGNKSTFSKLISPIVSVDFSELPVQADGSKISYLIPYNITQETTDGIVLTNLEFAEKEKQISCGDFRNGSPNIIRNDCTLQNRNATHLLCTCVRFTNVFAMETTVVTYHSYVYVEAIVISIVASGLVLLIIVGIIFACIKFRKNRKQEMTIVSDTHSSFSLRVQEVEMESFYGHKPVGLVHDPIPSKKEEKSRTMPVQSVYHAKRKTSQVIPLRVDLMDERYCDNLSSNGSDCEYSQ